MRKLALACAIILSLVLLGGSSRRERSHQILLRDTTPRMPPPPPIAGINNFSSSETVLFMWTASDPADSVVHYNVYRSFDTEEPPTELVAQPTSALFNDTSVVRGSPHHYRITAVNSMGRESASEYIDARPKRVRSVNHPAYFEFMHKDWAPADVIDYDNYSQLDGMMWGSQDFLVGEPAYVGLLDSLRVRNPDFVMLQYIWVQAVRHDWVHLPDGTPMKNLWYWLNNNDGWAKDTNGDRIVNSTDEGDAFNADPLNFGNPALADTLAWYYCEAWATGTNNKEFSGFLMDWANWNYPDWACNAGACRDILDYNQNGVAMENDADDTEVMRDYYRDLVRAFRREFGKRGWHDRLLVYNGNFSAYDTEVAGLVDGYQHEGWNKYALSYNPLETPAQTLVRITSLIDKNLDFGQSGASQTSPPLVIWHAIADSSSLYSTEPVALIANGWSTVRDYPGGDEYGVSTYSSEFTAPDRRIPTPTLTGGMFEDDWYNAYVSGDTAVISATFNNYSVRLNVNKFAAIGSGSRGPRQYFIHSASDTISIASALLYEPTPPASAITLDSWAFSAPATGDTTAGGNIEADITAALSASGFAKIQFAESGGSFADTSAVPWLTPESDDWSGLYDTGIAAPSADPDSGGIRITWDAATGHTGYILEMSHNEGAFVEVTNAISPDSTGYTHAADDVVPPRRGRLDYRLYSFSASDTSAAATHDSTFYNQATGVYARFFATPDTTGGDSLIVAGQTLLRQYVTVGLPPDPDTTPPDTTGVFAGVVVDTTNTSNIVFSLNTMTINEPAQVWFQWYDTVELAWRSPENWVPATASTSVADTVVTQRGITDLQANLTFRFQLRDDASPPNVSPWRYWSRPFARQAPSSGDYVATTGYVYVQTALASNIQVGIYDDTDESLVAASSTASITGTPGWIQVTFPTAPTLTAGNDYKLLAVADGTWYPAAAGGVYTAGSHSGVSVGTLPDPLVQSLGNPSTGVPSIYVTNAGSQTLIGVESVGSVTNESISNQQLYGGFGGHTCVTF